jgi:hypothetical protein
VKKAARRTLGAGVVAGVLFAAWRAYRARTPASPSEGSWAPAPFPFPPIPRPHATNAIAPSADPIDGECPESHPVKGKLASGIYHLPGGPNYARTRPDRCYVDAAAAESDGLRASKT